MIVHYDDPRGGLGNRGTKDLPGMHQRAVQQPTRDKHVAEHLTLAIECEQMKLLDLQVAQLIPKEMDHVLRFADPRRRGAFLPGMSDAELDGCQQPSGLGRADSAGAQKLGCRSSSQAPE